MPYNCGTVAADSLTSPPRRGIFFSWTKVTTETEKGRAILARTLWGKARGDIVWPDCGGIYDPHRVFDGRLMPGGARETLACARSHTGSVAGTKAIRTMLL